MDVLDLSNNNFAIYPPQIAKFTRLQTLHLAGNHLSQPLPSYLENSRNLLTLNLSNNKYDTWAGTGHIYSSIKRLDLSINKINNVNEAAISEMPQLNWLDLSENRINNLPPKLFTSAQNLETLILSRNYFSEVPRFQSNTLKSLCLSCCQISTLRADLLNGMTSLLRIDLSINQIESIPDNFASNTLQELDLGYNGIDTLTDFTFSSLPFLKVLNLRGNDFKEIWPTSRFSSNLNLREINVKGNRWSCEGFSVNLLLTYEYLITRVLDPTSLICYTPSNVTQLNWQEAYIRTWHLSESAETYTVAAVLIGIIIGIVITSLVCRGLVALNKSSTDSPVRPAETTILNLNGSVPQPRPESVVMRLPVVEEDLPPSYDEALLMPRLGSSFHSLPDFIDEEENQSRQYRRSRSIGDLTSYRPRTSDRRSVRRTVEIHIRTNSN